MKLREVQSNLEVNDLTFASVVVLFTAILELLNDCVLYRVKQLVFIVVFILLSSVT